MLAWEHNSICKIGITNNIQRRIAELQNASGCEIDVEFLAPLADNAQEVEAILHKEFKDYRGIGEWFNLDTKVVIESLRKKELIIEPKGLKVLT
jgi:hypothetical protein